MEFPVRKGRPYAKPPRLNSRRGGGVRHDHPRSPHKGRRPSTASPSWPRKASGGTRVGIGQSSWDWCGRRGSSRAVLGKACESDAADSLRSPSIHPRPNALHDQFPDQFPPPLGLDHRPLVRRQDQQTLATRRAAGTPWQRLGSHRFSAKCTRSRYTAAPSAPPPHIFNVKVSAASRSGRGTRGGVGSTPSMWPPPVPQRQRRLATPGEQIEHAGQVRAPRLDRCRDAAAERGSWGCGSRRRRRGRTAHAALS